MRTFIIQLTSSFLYIGYLPAIPGTFASIAGLILFYLLKNNTSVYIAFTLLLVGLGFLVSGEAEKMLRKKDPRQVVIDEVSGMLISLLFLPYYDLKIIVIGFFLFRILDTLKPFPAGSLQEIKGSIGIMSDDIIAALYTNIILQVALRLISSSAS